MPPYANATEIMAKTPVGRTKLELNMLSMNVVVANAARPSGPGSAGLHPTARGRARALVQCRLRDREHRDHLG